MSKVSDFETINIENTPEAGGAKMDTRKRNLEWLGQALGAVVVCGILYALFGSVGILYGAGFTFFAILSQFVASLLRPNVDSLNDATYKKNVQNLVDRQNQLKSGSE